MISIGLEFHASIIYYFQLNICKILIIKTIATGTSLFNRSCPYEFNVSDIWLKSTSQFNVSACLSVSELIITRLLPSVPSFATVFCDKSTLHGGALKASATYQSHLCAEIYSVAGNRLVAIHLNNVKWKLYLICSSRIVLKGMKRESLFVCFPTLCGTLFCRFLAISLHYMEFSDMHKA